MANAVETGSRRPFRDSSQVTCPICGTAFAVDGYAIARADYDGGTLRAWRLTHAARKHIAVHTSRSTAASKPAPTTDWAARDPTAASSDRRRP